MTHTHVQDLPLWASILISIFLLIGAGLTATGSFGLVRLRTFYDRLHAPTLGSSWGAAGIVMASMILFTVTQSRLAIHEILIGIFVTVTTPVTLMLLGRAALYRDRTDGGAVPAMDAASGTLEKAGTAADEPDPAEPEPGDDVSVVNPSAPPASSVRTPR